MPKRLSPPLSAKNKSRFRSLDADVIVPFLGIYPSVGRNLLIGPRGGFTGRTTWKVLTVSTVIPTQSSSC